MEHVGWVPIHTNVASNLFKNIFDGVECSSEAVQRPYLAACLMKCPRRINPPTPHPFSPNLVTHAVNWVNSVPGKGYRVGVASKPKQCPALHRIAQTPPADAEL